jgi:hypothetical protein
MAYEEIDISDIPEAVIIAAFTLTERIEDYLIDDVLADSTKAEAAYKQSALILHPDVGGSDREFIELKNSRDAVMRWHAGGQVGLKVIRIADEIGLEVMLAERLDDIACELNGIAEQLRRKPFAAIASPLKHQLERLQNVLEAGRLVTSGKEPELAIRLLQLGNLG